MEEIYISRTVRESQSAPTDFCSAARTGFADARVEERYSLKSITTRSTDGLALNVNTETIGTLHACFGRSSDPATANFYGEFNIGGIALKAYGECRTAKTDYPEPGLTVLRCSSEFRDLPAAYAGGQLTTNSLTSRNLLGDRTDPPGYVQSSIVTIRLWKHR